MIKYILLLASLTFSQTFGTLYKDSSVTFKTEYKNPDYTSIVTLNYYEVVDDTAKLTINGDIYLFLSKYVEKRIFAFLEAKLTLYYEPKPDGTIPVRYEWIPTITPVMIRTPKAHTYWHFRFNYNILGQALRFHSYP